MSRFHSHSYTHILKAINNHFKYNLFDIPVAETVCIFDSVLILDYLHRCRMKDGGNEVLQAK